MQNAFFELKRLFSVKKSPTMAPLTLNIDSFRIEGAEPDPEEKSAPPGFDPPQWKAFQVIRDFLQPKSSMLVADAVDQIINLFPNSTLMIRSINEIFMELAQQVPYNHSSQRKLAVLVCVFGRGVRLTKNEESKDFVALLKGYHTEIWDEMFDWQVDPHNDEGDPMRYVNYHAFLANLDANGLWYVPPVNIFLEMRYGLENDHGKTTLAEEEAFIMGPAQWILWNGQGLVRRLIWNPRITVRDKEMPAAKLSEKQLDKAYEMTRGKWRLWRDRFKQVATQKKFSQECRDVAVNAADMMEVLERSMPI